VSRSRAAHRVGGCIEMLPVVVCRGVSELREKELDSDMTSG
jgi:hypothetical protein